eukprot:1722038-Alexandrium_andersonii.AAC.1
MLAHFPDASKTELERFFRPQVVEMLFHVDGPSLFQPLPEVVPSSSSEDSQGDRVEAVPTASQLHAHCWMRAAAEHFVASFAAADSEAP